MDDSTFWFMMALLGLVFVVVLIEWLYKKFDPSVKEDEKDRHELLMKEIRRHDRD